MKYPISTISEVATTFLSLSSLVVGWLIDKTISINSVCVALFFLGFGNAITSIFFKAEVRRDMETLAETVADKVASTYRVEYMGDARDASKKFIEILKEAKIVINTHIVARNDIEALHDASLVKNLMHSYRLILANENVTWIDIIGGPRGNYKKRFENLTTDNIRANFHVYEVAALPATNFVIVKYFTGVEEVFWGWELHAQIRQNKVFRSKDKDIIDHYRGIHDALRERSAQIPISELFN